MTHQVRLRVIVCAFAEPGEGFLVTFARLTSYPGQGRFKEDK